MNDIPHAAPIPPQLPSPYPATVPLGDHPDDRIPITGPISAFEAILRQPRRVIFHLRQPGAPAIIAALCGIALVSALVYGLVVGTFSGGAQLWAAPAKIAGGMLITALICLPSLYIFSCLSGSHARLIEVVGLVAGLIGLTTILLIGFAPVAWVFSQSTSSVAAMGALHLVFWFIATLFGWKFLRNGFGHLSAKSGGIMHIWFVIFVLVCLQMTTALRPIVGTSDTLLPTEKKFFAAHWFNVLDQAGKVSPTIPTR
jgi:hypothetical protein